MRGLIARMLAGQARSPAKRPVTPGEALDASIAARRELRLAQPPRDERKRFERARPKVEQLRRDIAMRAADF